MLRKITHISLFVHDQNAALDFFTALGFKVHTDTQFGQMRWLTLNLPDQADVELALMQANSPEEKSLVGAQSVAPAPVLAVSTDDCRAEYARLKGLGVTFLDEPKEEPWGIGCSFKDICGNIWYLCQAF